MGTYVSISGSNTNADVRIYGNGSVIAGNGNDTIQIGGNGHITVGAGNDQLSLHGSGSITQNNAGTQIGNDTINLGRGNDTISEAGRATVYGAFGSATIQGGKFEFLRVLDGSHDDGSRGGRHDDGARGGLRGEGRDGSHHDAHDGSHGSHHYVFEEIASSGNATLVGGDHCTQFVAGSGSVVMQGGKGNDTFVGGSGHATMTGGSGHNLFDFACHSNGGQDIITNFVAGQDKLYLEGKSLCYLQSHGDISVNHGNTYISLDGGKTMVELKGFTSLNSHDVTTHKG